MKVEFTYKKNEDGSCRIYQTIEFIGGAKKQWDVRPSEMNRRQLRESLR